MYNAVHDAQGLENQWLRSEPRCNLRGPKNRVVLLLFYATSFQLLFKAVGIVAALIK